MPQTLEQWTAYLDADGLDGPELAPKDDEDEGCYYVLGIDTTAGTFLLQHDTFHAGRAGMHRAVSTFTSIRFESVQYPGSGRLRDFILYLVDRFGPNQFSLT